MCSLPGTTPCCFFYINIQMSSSPTQKTMKNGALRFTVSYVASSLIFSFRLLWLTVGRVLTNTKSIPSLPDTHSTVSGCTSKCPWTSCWTLKCSRRLLHGCGRASEHRKKNMGHFGYLYCCGWAGRLLAWQLCYHCLSVCECVQMSKRILSSRWTTKVRNKYNSIYQIH